MNAKEKRIAELEKELATLKKLDKKKSELIDYTDLVYKKFDDIFNNLESNKKVIEIVNRVDQVLDNLKFNVNLTFTYRDNLNIIIDDFSKKTAIFDFYDVDGIDIEDVIGKKTLNSFKKEIMEKMNSIYLELYPVVKEYVESYDFGIIIPNKYKKDFISDMTNSLLSHY